MRKKPLGKKSYGHIPHLPGSRIGPGDHKCSEGQNRIATKKKRDRHDLIVVQEKLDGACTAVALLNGQILALGRAGYLARSSPYEQHHIFADWVDDNESRFRSVLDDGERLVGEWLAMAHGTRYDLQDHEPWGCFDLMTGHKRATYWELIQRVGDTFHRPSRLHVGGPISVSEAIKKHEDKHWPCEQIEGIVYRVERRGKVDFLAKWVRPDKEDGKYLESVTGKAPIWNWRPSATSACAG